jgi:membrane associated rhomboid family serine protease
MSVQVIIVGVCFALMGLAAFARPANLVAMLGLPAETPDARNEVQAVYGGFGLGVAAILLSTMWYPQYREGVILAVVAALAGMAGGRVIAALRERPGRVPVLFFVIEAAGAAFLYTAL